MRTFLLRSLVTRAGRRYKSVAIQGAVTDVDSRARNSPVAIMEEKSVKKIDKIVADIASLTLLEVADLNEALKKKLNVPDTLPMSYSAMASGPAAGAKNVPKEEEQEDTPVVPVKTSFTIKLVKYDEAKKMDIIKELRNTIPSLNLVQSKKLVESCPQVLKKDVGKDEVDKIKLILEKVGGICEIE